MPPLVSAIILNYNGAVHLPDCLSSLTQQAYPRLEIIISDNGSTDDSAGICGAFRNVRFMDNGKNLGFSRGNNCGAKHSNGRYLFFLNNDMRFPSDLVSNLVDIAEATPSLFALDARQLSWDGTRVVHAASRYCKQGWGGIRFLPGVRNIQFETDETIAVPTANGANLFCVAERFYELGGFDPTFFLHWEDVDLCWRARLRGWEIRYSPQAYCWHKVSIDTQREARLSSRYERMIAFSIERNRYRFIAKHMNSKRNLAGFTELIERLARHLVRGRLTRASILLAAYSQAVGRFWEVQAHKRRHGSPEDGSKSEDILHRFWLEDDQVSELVSEKRIIG